MRVVRPAALVAVIALVAACSGSPTSTATPGTSPAPGGSDAPSATRVEVRLTDSLRIEPAVMQVPAAQPVTFVVTNVGVLEHEFFLGSEEEQAEHDDEMAGSGGMVHDEPMGIGVSPGQTKELTVTFAEPGSTLAGCHVDGHYLAGMKATIEIRG